MGTHNMSQSKSPSLDERQFEILARLVKDRIGLFLRPEKRELVESRLRKRLNTLNLCSFAQYLDVLRSDENGTETTALSQTLTTNVTSFFREEHHFDTLRDLAQTQFLPRLKRGEDIRIWSAGCSNGAEPYSMAMTLFDAIEPCLAERVKILATDIDMNVLSQARAGIYTTRSTENLSAQTLDRHFDQHDSGYRISDKVRKIVQFRILNLVEKWPISKHFAVIFCRNVVIYFDTPTQENLWERFLKQLENGGHLMIGHSERLDENALTLVNSVGVTSYQKLDTKKVAK